MNKAVAVLISDVHYNLKTIDVANAAMTLAINKAIELNVDLIVSGDLHDTKANVRGECIIAINKTFTRRGLTIHVLRGNHDSLNEKSTEHSLHFLPVNCMVYSTPQKFERNMLHSLGVGYPDVYLVPYFHDADELREYLKTVPPKSTLIMHQGIQGSNAGEYFQDKSALRPEDVAGFRVISGHYHTRQTIDLPDGGRWDYVGNPFTLNFAEANDPIKGFQILYDDGSLEFVPTNLRKHIVIELDQLPYGQFARGLDYKNVKENDLVWVKVYGTKEDLQKLVKENIATNLGVKDFKLELIPDEVKTEVQHNLPTSQPELLDSLIDSLSNTTPAQKQRLKAIWKDLCDNA